MTESFKDAANIIDNNFKFSDEDEGIRQQFKPYSELIENLTNSFIINTSRTERDNDDILMCDMSKNSENLIIIM